MVKELGFANNYKMFPICLWNLVLPSRLNINLNFIFYHLFLKFREIEHEQGKGR